MIRTLILVICCTALCGCIWPHIERYEPVGGLLVHDPKTGEVHRRMLETVVLDAETKEPISNADVILVLSRSSAYLPDSGGGQEKSPKIVFKKFSDLSTLTYTDRELYVWPFFAVGTLYGSSAIFIYKRGYEPAAFDQNPRSFEHPKVIEPRHCPPDVGEARAIEMALGVIRRDEWKEGAKAELKKKLSAD